MSQHWIIRLIPLEAFMLAALLGWLITSGVWRVERGALDASRSTLHASLSPVFTPEVRHWEKDIVKWSAAYGIEPNLAATVMQIESCGNPQAVSGAGARGLFQVMPYHFEAGEDMLDPETNASRGLSYLAQGLTRAGGQAGLALAGYNGGHSQIGRDSSLWPGETQRYYYWGTGIYADAVAGADHSDRLSEWLAAGGASLCAKAADELGN